MRYPCGTTGKGGVYRFFQILRLENPQKKQPKSGVPPAKNVPFFQNKFAAPSVKFSSFGCTA